MHPDTKKLVEALKPFRLKRFEEAKRFDDLGVHCTPGMITHWYNGRGNPNPGIMEVLPRVVAILEEEKNVAASDDRERIDKLEAALIRLTAIVQRHCVLQRQPGNHVLPVQIVVDKNEL